MDPRLEALEQLGRLRDQKVLSEAEFEAEKSRLLSPNESASAGDPIALLADKTSFLKRKKVWIPLVLLVAILSGAYLGLSTSNSLGGKEEQAAKTLPVQSGQLEKTQSLSSILKFDRPDECKPGDELKAIFSDLRALEPGGSTKTINLGLNGSSHSPEVLRAEQGNAVIARLGATGILEGLHVTELKTTRFNDSDAEVYQIGFAESADRVRTKLNDLGFSIPKPGELKTYDFEDGRGLVYGVEQLARGAALTCASL